MVKLELHEYEKLYVRNGFFWNRYLSELVEEYGGKEICIPDPRAGVPDMVRFCVPVLIRAGHASPDLQAASEFFKEEVAPVGECRSGHIELLLTASGQLFGFNDYLLLNWAGPEALWRSSIENLIRGVPPEHFALIGADD